MTHEATVEFKFDSTYTPNYESGFSSTIDDDFIPEEHFVITAPAADLSARQYFKLFEKFMLAVGMSPDNIRSAAMSLVFNDWTNESEQRKVCDEYELTMNEDLHEKFKEWKERDEEWARLGKKTNTVADNVEAMYWKNKYIQELSTQGKLEDPDRPFEVKPGVFVETVSIKESSNDPANNVLLQHNGNEIN